MKKVYSAILISGFALLGMQQSAKAQFSATPDTIHTCPTQAMKAKASFLPPNTVTLRVDDQFGPIQNIGFDFNYFGSNYNQCVVSGNNFLTFNTALANTGSSYQFPVARNNGQIDNAILFPFQDTNPAIGLATANPFRSCSFMYGNPGTRRYVVQFCRMPLYSCANILSSSQVVLYEGTNIIDIHIIERQNGCAWENGTAIVGLKNNTTEIFVPGKGTPNVDWADAGKTYRFTPNAAGGYDLDSLPYSPIPIILNGDTSSIYWYVEGDTVNPIARGQNVELVADGVIKYFVAKYQGPGLCTSLDTVTYYDTIWVNYLNYTGVANVEICDGETYNFYGQLVFKPGDYSHMLKTTLGCDSLLKLNLILNPLPIASTDADNFVYICEGLTKKITATNGSNAPDPNNTYVWYKDGQVYPGSTTSEIILSEAGRYYLEVITPKGCKSISTSFDVVIRPNPIAQIEYIGNGEVQCTHDTIDLVALEDENYTYKWSPELYLRPYNYNMSGHHVRGVFRNTINDMNLTVWNQYGCVAETDFKVYAKPCCDVYVPNAFTPNNDGNNDYFYPSLNPAQTVVSFEVFDRFGTLVYSSVGKVLPGWDGNYTNGKQAPTGVYMYQIIYTCDDGQNYTKKEAVTLMR